MGPGSGMALRRAFTDGDWRYKCCEKEGVMTEKGKDDGNGHEEHGHAHLSLGVFDKQHVIGTKIMYGYDL